MNFGSHFSQLRWREALSPFRLAFANDDACFHNLRNRFDGGQRRVGALTQTTLRRKVSDGIRHRRPHRAHLLGVCSESGCAAGFAWCGGAG